MKITRFQFLFSVMYSPDATENTSRLFPKGGSSPLPTWLVVMETIIPKGEKLQWVGNQLCEEMFQTKSVTSGEILKLYLVYHNNVFYFCNCINQYTLKQVSNNFVFI